MGPHIPLRAREVKTPLRFCRSIAALKRNTMVVVVVVVMVMVCSGEQHYNIRPSQARSTYHRGCYHFPSSNWGV